MGGGPVVVAGEALIDLLLDAPVGGDGDALVRAAPGGGPYNTARALGRLGTPTVFAGRLSGDAFGRRLAAGLAASGVRLMDPAPLRRPTTLAVAEVDDDGSAAYDFYWEGTAATAMAESDLARISAYDPAALHMGTLGLLLEPTGALLERLAGEVPGTTVVMVDPNCRPGVTPDPGAYRSRILRLLARTDVLKLSVEDLAFLDPGPAPLDAAAQLAGRVPVVLLTGGAAGAWLFCRGEVHHQAAPSITVVDTVGAGDTFGGAFLDSVHRAGCGRDLGDIDLLRSALQRAVVAAAVCCTRSGAVPPDRAELDAALR